MTVKMKIIDYLKDYHVGADNALLGSRLCSIFGLASSLLRKSINELRVEGYPVCSDSNGYFYAGCPEEIDITIAHLASRSREMDYAKEGLRRAKDNFGKERDTDPDEVTP